MSSTRLAEAVLELLLDAGLEHLVVCPGSRSAPLAFAAHDAATAGRLTLHTRIDERTAGFLALGIAKSGHRPTAVICTSGTAAANLHPAVLEAAHSGAPLVAVTADRPAALRGTGANQTTDQVGLYGAAAPWWDIDSPGDLDAVTLGDGPAHLNVQLSEPLVPDAEVPVVEEGAPAPVTRPPGDPDDDPDDDPGNDPDDDPDDDPGTPRRRWAEAPDAVRLPLGPRTVVVAGDGAGPAARGLAERVGWPLLAEPSSGARTGDHAIRTYRLLLEGPLGAQVERVVVLGHPTLSRPVTTLLRRPDVEVVSVPHRGRWPTRPHPVSLEAHAVTADPDDREWLEAWRAEDTRLSGALDALVDGEGLGPHAVAREVSAAVPPGGQLFVGASNPIRDLDLMAARYEVGRRRKVLANRGLAGIDGSISTAIGASLVRPGERSLALVGDVTFLHDANALVLGPDEARPDLVVVVVNDDGGSIFASLEQGAPAYSSRFERLFATPHSVDLAALCAATRTPHWRVGSVPELRQALASPNGGIEVIEARVRRDNRRELDAAIRELVTTP